VSTSPPSLEDSLRVLLKALKLPGFLDHYADLAVQAEKDGTAYGQYLHALAEYELRERRDRRIQRALKASALPLEKTLATLDLSRLPPKVRKRVPTLCEAASSSERRTSWPSACLAVARPTSAAPSATS